MWGKKRPQGLNLQWHYCASSAKTTFLGLLTHPVISTMLSEIRLPNMLLYIFPCFSHIWGSSQALSSFPMSRNQVWETLPSWYLQTCPSFYHYCYWLNSSLHVLSPGKAAWYRNKHTNDWISQRVCLTHCYEHPDIGTISGRFWSFLLFTMGVRSVPHCEG